MSKIKKTSNGLPIQYRLNTIEELSYFHKSPKLFNIKNFNRDKVKFSINGGLNWIEAKNEFEIGLKITFTYPQEKGEETIQLFGIQTLITYDIKNPEGVIVQKDEKSFNINTNILTTLFSISLSTTRGMLTSNNLKTDYYDIHIPIINPQQVLKDLWGEILPNSIKTISKNERVR